MFWWVGALLMLGLALVLQSGLLAYSMYALAALMLVSRALASRRLNDIHASRKPRSRVLETGETAIIRVKVVNRGAAPVPWLLLEDLLPKSALRHRDPSLEVEGRRLKLVMLAPRGETEVKYRVRALRRGYHQIGPLVVEHGDLFGLYRRFKVLTEPAFILVLPKVIPVQSYELASRRPVGEIRLAHRLFEDPTLLRGIRAYEPGDPLRRIHWRATARTGVLQCKLYEPSCLAGSTLLLDFHADGYHRQGEPFRSDLAVVAAASLVGALCGLKQQVGMITNGRDAAERVRTEGYELEPDSRVEARNAGREPGVREHLHPVVLPTRRGEEQLARVREILARLEPQQGLTLEQLIATAQDRIPRDATVLCLLPRVTLEAAMAIGDLRRQGYAVSVVLIAIPENDLPVALARLTAERLLDVRHLRNEDQIPLLCGNQVDRSSPYAVSVE